MTTTAAAEQIGTLFVRRLPSPRPRDRSSGIAVEEWRSWSRCIASFATLHRWRPIQRPVRCVATVRIADQRRHNITAASLPRWEAACRDGLRASGLVPEPYLRSIEVRYEALDGVPLLDQPLCTGTEFQFFASEDDRCPAGPSPARNASTGAPRTTSV